MGIKQVSKGGSMQSDPLFEHIVFCMNCFSLLIVLQLMSEMKALIASWFVFVSTFVHFHLR